MNVDADNVIIRTDGPIYEIVNQGSTKTESYIHKINADEDITQSWIIFKTELPFFDGKLQYTFTNWDKADSSINLVMGFVLCLQNIVWTGLLV